MGLQNKTRAHPPTITESVVKNTSSDENNKPPWCRRPCPAARRGDAGILSSSAVLRPFAHPGTFFYKGKKKQKKNMQARCWACCATRFYRGARCLTREFYFFFPAETLLSDQRESAKKKKREKKKNGMCIEECARTIEASPLRGSSLGEKVEGAAGFIFRVDLSQVHLTAPERKPVLTDRPLRRCQSMKGMNEHLISLC